VITNDVSDYINLLVRIAHIICNHPLYAWFKNTLITCEMYLTILNSSPAELNLLHYMNHGHALVYKKLGMTDIKKKLSEQMVRLFRKNT
jgi:hypothetical protein